MTDWQWIPPDVVYQTNRTQAGGRVINDNGIRSAIARPVNLASYGSPDAADLAAAYAYGLVQNHGFVDGNKRTAWLTARTFLEGNGFHLKAFSEQEAIDLMEALAAHHLSEQQLADWFRRHL